MASTASRISALLLVAGCSSDDPGRAAPDAAPAPAYVVASIVTDAEQTSTYVSVLDGVGAQTIDYARARELPGQQDVWAHDGALFVADGESRTITKFAIAGHDLVEGERISFAAYGLSDFGFWRNVFVADDKAYFGDGVDTLVVWNPRTMEITGSIALPALAARDGKRPFPAYTDRAAPIRDGRVYLPVYYTDESYFEYAPSSSIRVVDIAGDRLVETLEAPCPGIDFATGDGDGNLYFSSWVFAPPGAALLDQPATCVARVAAGATTVDKLADVAAIFDGREGGVMRYLGGSVAMLSVLDPAHSDSRDVADVAFGANWRFYTYHLATGATALVDGVDWNAGAAYGADVDGRPYMLVPAGDYSSTRVFALSPGAAPALSFETRGWALRLFRVR